MDISKNNTYMQEPHHSLVENIFVWLQANWFQMGILGLLYQLINKVYKYFSDSRDAELRKIVKEEMNGPIEALTKQITELSKAVWNINNK